MCNYAAATAGVTLCEVAAPFANHNETSAFLTKRLGNVLGGYSVDGTHVSGTARLLLAAEFADYHGAIGRLLVPRGFGNTGTFDPVKWPSVNVLGDAGNVQGPAGLKNSAFAIGVAGVSAASRLSLNNIGTAKNVATCRSPPAPAGLTARRRSAGSRASTKASPRAVTTSSA